MIKKRLVTSMAMTALAATLAIPGGAFGAKVRTLKADGDVLPFVPAGSVAINENNFPDENFREYIRFLADGDNDGILDDMELASVTSINVTDGNITSVKGVEFFTELTKLRVSVNGLTELDVSCNTKLSELVCFKNQLTELDLSNNPNLTYLSCGYNQFDKLDVSHNPLLEELYCQANYIEKLNLRNNALLRKMFCYGNKLTKLDIHNCPIMIDLIKTGTKMQDENDGYVYSSYSKKTTKAHLNIEENIPICLELQKPETVTGLSATSAGKNKVKLSWSAVEDADGYLVYAQKDGKYGYVGMTTKGTAFTDTKALDYDYNYYWVFAYVQENGKMYPGGCEKYVYAKGVCLAVTGLKASSVTGGVKLTWTGSSGAEGYLVYGIHPGASYGYIGMTTKGTTFTDKNASKTDWNFYWVFPYHKYGDKMIVGGTPKYVYGKAK